MNGTLTGMLTGVLISSFVDADGKTVDYSKISILGDKSETVMAVGCDLKLANKEFGTDELLKKWKHQEVILTGVWNYYMDRENNKGEWKFKTLGITPIK